MSTIYMPNFMQPYQMAIDMGKNQIFSAKVNGNQIDAYKLVIKKLDNSILYDSAKVILAQKLYNKQTLNVAIVSGIISCRGQLKWILTYYNGTELVSSGEMIFTNMTTPIITSDVPSTVATRLFKVHGTYSQLESIPLKKWNIELFDSNDVSIQSSGDIYSSLIEYDLDGLVNNVNYYIVMNIETQSSTGVGMAVSLTKNFSVKYAELILGFEPTLTQLEDKASIQVDWSLLSQNAGVITGTSSYIDSYLKDDNIGLSLDSASNLKYDDFVIPSVFTMSFMKQIPKDFNGILFTTKDGDYKIGYSNIQPTAESNITYTGTWTAEGAVDSHTGNTRRSNILNNNVNLSYAGTGVRMCFIQSVNMGIVEVIIDGVSVGAIDLYKALGDNAIATTLQYSVNDTIMQLQEHNESKKWNDLSTKTWNNISTLNIENLVFKYIMADISDYMYDAHNIKFNVTGTKNTSSSDTQVNLKSIEVLNGFCDNKFYSIIQGETTYGEKIKITDNPFIFTLLPNKVKIKQYNSYEILNNVGHYSWNDIQDYTIDFLGQKN